MRSVSPIFAVTGSQRWEGKGEREIRDKVDILSRSEPNEIIMKTVCLLIDFNVSSWGRVVSQASTSKPL